MTQPSQPDPFAGRVVVGTDGSDEAHTALLWAAQYARQVGAEVVLVHGWEMPIGSVRTMSYDSQVVDEAHAAAQRTLEDASRWLRDALPASEPHIALVPGGPTKALLEASTSALCVVVGSRGRGALTSALLGSTSDHVAAHGHCPVVVVPTGAEWRDDAKVLLASDGSDGARSATGHAFGEASRLGVGLEVLTVIDPMPMIATDPLVMPPAPELLLPETREVVEQALVPFRAEHPDVPVEVVAEVGPLEEVVAERSSEASIVVTGSRGRGALVSLLTGSASREVLAGARCPVTVVH